MAGEERITVIESLAKTGDVAGAQAVILKGVIESKRHAERRA